MPKRHAKTPQELESLLLDGILSAEPVQEEITADSKQPCAKHSELINPVAVRPE